MRQFLIAMILAALTAQAAIAQERGRPGPPRGEPPPHQQPDRPGPERGDPPPRNDDEDRRRAEEEQQRRDSAARRERAKSAMSVSKVSEAPGPIQGVVGIGDYNHSSGDETKCRSSVIKTAEANAVELCKAKFGVDCTVTKRGEATFELKKKRYICTATAEAQPAAEFKFQCAAEITAKATVR